METCKNCGKPLILSGGKCIYCGASTNSGSQSVGGGQQEPRRSRPIIQRKTLTSRPNSIEDLLIKVTSPGCDDMGSILNRMGIQYIPFDGDCHCDILFLNCCTGDVVGPGKLKGFVQNGGVLYASDLTAGVVLAAFPDLMHIVYGTQSCTIRAQVEDADLRQYLGSKINVKFDLGGWAKISDALTGKVLMRNVEEGYPIMVEYSVGQGKVFFTSFHNHAQTAEAEEKLLKLLVIKQVSAATKQGFQQTMTSLSVSL